MKVLLLNTPFYRLMGSHYNGLSLGLLYIAAVLREDGHEVAVFNADYENRSDYLDQTGIFEGCDRYKAIHNMPDHPIWQETIQQIVDFNPDYVGITMFTANFRAAQIIARGIKKINPLIKIVVGGVHPTLAPEEVMQESLFDFVITGEGEYAMSRLCSGVQPLLIVGLGYRDSLGRVHINNSMPYKEFIINLDYLPFPARDLIINPHENTDFGMLVTGRGCAFNCTFCASPAMWGSKPVRLRSVDNIMQELHQIKDLYPHNVIYFEDDTFTMKKSRTIELCKRIINSDINIKWKCDTRADCVDEELLEYMKVAGCITIKIGVESGSDRILKSINKRVSKDRLLQAARNIKKYNIPLTIYLMTGFPNETDEDLKQTIEFAKEIDPNYCSLSILAPYYGTEIYKKFVAENGELNKEHWEYFYHQSNIMPLNKNLSSFLIQEFLSLNEGKIRI